MLVVDGEDVRALALKERRALLEKVVRRHRIQKSQPSWATARRRSGRCAGSTWRGSWRSGLGIPMARERSRLGESSLPGSLTTILHHNTHLSMSLRGRGFVDRDEVPWGILRLSGREQRPFAPLIQ